MPKVSFKKAFTLFELILVIVIIGVVYALMIQNFNFGIKKEESISLANIPSYLRKHFSKTKEKITLLCYNDCSTCKVFAGGKEAGEINSFFEKYSSPQAYVLVDGRLEKKEFVDYFEDHKNKSVCFEYNLYPNKSSDKMVLEYKDVFYMYDNFFEKTRQFRDLGDANDFWVEQREKFKGD